MEAYGINRGVVFANEVGLGYFMFLLAKHAKKIGSAAFVKSANYYERLTCFQMRPNLDKERKRLINRR